MKIIFIALAFGSFAVSASGQGTVNIGTGAGANTKFIVTYTGERIAGEAYWAQLFYANGTVADENALMAAGSPIHPRTGTAAGVLPSGEVRLEGISPPGGVATLQIRVWSAVLGDSHDEAFQAWQSQAPNRSHFYGRSAVFFMDTASPLEAPPPPPPSIASAFPGMCLLGALECVPEPSTVAFSGLGAIGLLVLFAARTNSTRK